MSQSADLLALLSDGRPHEMRAIHRAIGFMRLNSRVAELRGRGYRIECDKTGGQYVYTLVSRPLEGGSGEATGLPACHAAPELPSSGATAGSSVRQTIPTDEPHGAVPLDLLTVEPDGQLALVAA